MVALFRLLALIPLSWMQRLGALCGRLLWALSPRWRARFENHARGAGFAPAQYRPAAAAAGAMVAELPWLWLRGPDVGVLDRVRWEGVDRFEAALDEGRGVILVTPHLGSWEMACQALAERYGRTRQDMVALYRPARKAWLAPLVAQSRNRAGVQAVPTTTGGVRSLVKTLRAGSFTLILPDQVPPDGQGVWAPFFGRPAYTMTLLPRLARQTGATVLLCWCERLAPGDGFVMHVEPMDGNGLGVGDPAATPESAAQALNAAMERLIRQAPGQYLWSYARYKQPPKDES